MYSEVTRRNMKTAKETTVDPWCPEVFSFQQGGNPVDRRNPAPVDR